MIKSQNSLLTKNEDGLLDFDISTYSASKRVVQAEVPTISPMLPTSYLEVEERSELDGLSRQLGEPSIDPHPVPKSSFNSFLGMLIMSLSVVLFASSTILCKIAYMENPSLSGFDYLLFRSIIMVVSSLTQAYFFEANLRHVPNKNKFILFMRIL